MIIPIGKTILVKVDTVTETEGIVLPEKYAREEEIVEVLAIGEEVTKVAPGDRIVAMPSAGLEIPIDGKPSVFIKESDVIAKVSGEEPSNTSSTK